METLKKVWEFMKGKKTYFVAFLGIVVSGLFSQGYIDEPMYTSILAVLGALGLATVRHGMK